MDDVPRGIFEHVKFVAFGAGDINRMGVFENRVIFAVIQNPNPFLQLE